MGLGPGERPERWRWGRRVRLVLDQGVSHIVMQVQQALLLLSGIVEKFSFFFLVFILKQRKRVLVQREKERKSDLTSFI